MYYGLSGCPRWLLEACILTGETGLSVQTETGSSHGFSWSASVTALLNAGDNESARQAGTWRALPCFVTAATGGAR